jgi:hypothetical protein
MLKILKTKFGFLLLVILLASLFMLYSVGTLVYKGEVSALLALPFLGFFIGFLTRFLWVTFFKKP